MRVRDLLTMTTGHAQARRLKPEDGVWTKVFLEHPVTHPPGTFFKYNTPATYIVSAIIQKKTGARVLDYLGPRLFEPLGIENPKWETSPEGISLGGYGLSVRSEDIARLGQLYLQNGMWNGRQLIPKWWATSATSRQVSNGTDPDNDWNQGYGFQFWRSRHDCYRGDGAFGQFCIVSPKHDAVIITTAGTNDMAAIMNLIWDKLLPAMQADALPDAAGSTAELRQTLLSPVVPAQEGAADSPIAKKISGRQFVFVDNNQNIEMMSVECGSDGTTTLMIRNDSGDYRATCGQSRWVNGQLALGPYSEQPVSISSAWTAEDTLTAKFCFVETPHTATLSLKFDGDRLTVDTKLNVGFLPPPIPQLTGKAK